MKYYILLAVFCGSCLMAMGEVSKDQLREAQKLVQMNGVRDRTDKKKSGEFEVLEFDFSSKKEGLEDVYVRIAVELKDKEKKMYLVKEMQKYSDDFGDEYVGEGHWKLEIPHGSFKKLKMSAYAIEFGLMDGKKFIPFDADYDHVKTWDELTARTAAPFPGECKLRLTYMVDE